MKKMILMAAIMLSSVSAFAQNEVGQFTLQPKVGINFANLTGDGTKGKVGFVGGLEAEYGIAENFGLTLGAMYSMEGAKLDDVDAILNGVEVHGAKDNFNFAYLNVPVMLQYYVVPGLAVKAGAQFGFRMSAKEKISKDGNSANINIKDGVEGFNFAIPVGISYEYKNVVLDGRYIFGATKSFKNVEKNKTSLFQITLGYKFAL